MEKVFTNKSIWKKIVIAILVVMTFQVIVFAPIVKADDAYNGEEGDALGWGGVLLKPVMSLLLTLGDGVMQILHSSIMGINAALLHIDLQEGNILWQILKIVVTVVVLAVAAIAAVVTLGGSAVVTAAVLAVIGGTALGIPVVTAVGEGVNNLSNSIMHTAASAITGDYTPDDIYLPIYTYTPEEIFKGNILLFNVNFFSNSKDIYVCYGKEEETTAKDDTRFIYRYK